MLKVPWTSILSTHKKKWDSLSRLHYIPLNENSITIVIHGHFICTNYYKINKCHCFLEWSYENISHFFAMYQPKKLIQGFFGIYLIFGKVYKYFNLNFKLIMGLPLLQRWKIATNWTYFLFIFTTHWWVDQCKCFHFWYIKFFCSSNKDLVQPQALKFWPYTFLDVFGKLSSLGYKSLCFPSMEVHILHLIWWTLPLLSITLSHQCKKIAHASLKCIYPPMIFFSLFSTTFGLNDSPCIFSQLKLSFMQININSIMGGDLDLYTGRWDWIWN